MQNILILERGRAERHYWLDLWRYRELFQVLAWRDLSVRYKQTVIGTLWALIRPLLTMLVLAIVFGRIAKLPSDGTAPYALMVFSGLLPWTFFSTGLAEASNSLVNNSNLISGIAKQIYCRRPPGTFSASASRVGHACRRSAIMSTVISGSIIRMHEQRERRRKPLESVQGFAATTPIWLLPSVAR